MSSTITLTRRQLTFLRELRLREAAEHEAQSCWLANRPRGTYQLIVPTLTGRYEAQQLYHGSRVLRPLHATGLITYGPDQPIPETARVASGDWGSTVTLTDAGRALPGVSDA